MNHTPLMLDQVLRQLTERHWHNWQKLKAHLRGEVPYPVKISLKATFSGAQLLHQADEFRHFINHWKQAEQQEQIQLCWQTRQFQHFGLQQIPTHLLVNSITQLAALLGKQTQLEQWKQVLSDIILPLKDWQAESLFYRLIDFLPTLCELSSSQRQILVQLLPQLTPNLGKGCYLRALPIESADTKFIEQHQPLIEAILSVKFGDIVQQQGLLNWLNCQLKPQDWLLVKPLCPKVQQALGGLPILRLPSKTLYDITLPAQRILLIENEQSALALPPIDNAIAIAGSGKNLNWLSALWLQQKQLAYWGDIDSEGFNMLSLARQKCPHLTALMMNKETVMQFEQKMVSEPDSIQTEPTSLLPEERELFHQLRQDQFFNRRLEQERIENFWIENAITNWLSQLN